MSDERDEPEAYVESVSIEQGHRVGYRYGVGTSRFPNKIRLELLANTAFAHRLWDWLNNQGIGRETAPNGALRMG